MSQKYIAVTEILMDLEKELRQLNLWDFELPSAEALASTEPFAVDTLNFPQWLQVIFIPRLYFMVKHCSALPTNCAVTAMAEEYFQALNANTARVISHLQKMDSLLSEQ